MTAEEVKENMLANLRDWMLEFEEKGRSDSDPVSVEGFVDDDGRPVGGLMLIRTPGAFAQIKTFLECARLLTPGKGIVDGTGTDG